MVAHAGGDVDAALAEVEVQGRFVPVQDGEVELVAAGGEAQLRGGRKDTAPPLVTRRLLKGEKRAAARGQRSNQGQMYYSPELPCS